MKKKILKTVFSLCAIVALVSCSISTFAQDDLEDLLKELEGETAEKKPEEAKAEEPKAEAEAKAEEPPAEEANGEEPKEEESKADEQQPEAAEPAAEEAKDEVPEAAAAAEPVAEAAEPEAAKPAAELTKDEESSKDEESPKDEEPPKDEEKVADAELPQSGDKAAEADKKVDEELSLLDDLDSEGKADDAQPESPAVAAKPAEPQATAPDKPAEAAPAKPRPKRVGPDAELLENIAATERTRRETYDKMAMKEILAARECMQSKEYPDAVRHYGLARKFLNDSPKSRPLRKECESGVTEGLYLSAIAEENIGRHAEARKLMEKALEMRHPKASEMLAKWKADREEEALHADTSEVAQVRNEDGFKAERETARRHLRRARQYLALRDIPRALDECEIVLKTNPNNQEATRLRQAIERKRQLIHEQVRSAMRDGMIADVDDAWRPVYAVNAAQLDSKASETVKAQAGEDPERTQEQDIEKRMKEMRLPTIEFKPPATIIEAIEFFRTASRDYDRPDIPIEKRGFNFVLRTPVGAIRQQAAEESSDDFSMNDSDAAGGTSNGLEPIPKITASDITFYDALKLVCDAVGYKFIVRGPVVMVMQKDMSTAELLSRKYNVPEAFVERVNTASEEIKEMGGFGASNRSAKRTSSDDEGDGSADRNWKAFFEEMGVKWPEGSSIKHIKALGKLYVRNTRENLAEFEKVLDELGGQPQLIEIETRFVEVSQEDLNSLGFEWILNSDMNLFDRFGLGKALGLKPYGTVTTSTGTSDGSSSGGSSSGGISGGGSTGGGGTSTGGIGSTLTTTTTTPTTPTVVPTTRTTTARPGVRMNAISGVTDFSDTSNMRSTYSNGNRYLSTTGNHISGEGAAYNDQFMRVNAFLGQADLSMILHMLSQRSDTDLLSAPKVVTKSGEQAVIKVVTEYIYPQDYNVQLQSSSSSSSGSSSSSSSGNSAILAVVEPQNFTMREVGVILDVLPTYSEANGGTIDLELKPSVVDEPTWKNYGMQIPFTGNVKNNSVVPDFASIINAMVSAVTTLGTELSGSDKSDIAQKVVSTSMNAIDNLSTSSEDSMTWYDAPMEQPFFHVRSIESKVSITPGATVVMGGLITEQRKAMDDKVPFLGDLPFVGRFFRSHAEQTIKRNLLIFVTGRLITPSGREIRMNAESLSDAEVKPAPSAE